MLDSVFDYTTCPSCGTSVAPEALSLHRCEERHRQDHIVRTAAEEAEAFEAELAAFLASPHGRFAVYDARRRRMRGD